MNWLLRLRAILDPRYVARRARHNFLLKAFSVFFALGLWAFVNLGARDTEKTFAVPLELRNVPPLVMIASPVVDTVDVRVRGSRTLLGSIDERRLRIGLDLANVRPGSTSFKLDADALSLPRGIRVTRISPVQVTLDVERVVKKTLPVVANIGAGLPSGYRIVETEVRPSFVTVTGPENAVEELKSISTAPVPIRTSSQTFEQPVPLERPTDLLRIVPEEVLLRGRVEEIQSTRQMHDVEVGVKNAAGSPRVRPNRVDVTLRAPRRILQDLALSRDNVFVDARDLAPGNHRRRIEVVVPQGVEVAEIRPAEVSVEIAAEKAPRRSGTR
jgi:YbbR domain-containing protein